MFLVNSLNFYVNNWNQVSQEIKSIIEPSGLNSIRNKIIACARGQHLLATVLGVMAVAKIAFAAMALSFGGLAVGGLLLLLSFNTMKICDNTTHIFQNPHQYFRMSDFLGRTVKIDLNTQLSRPARVMAIGSAILDTMNVETFKEKFTEGTVGGAQWFVNRVIDSLTASSSAATPA